MPTRIVVPKETLTGEKRVALVPNVAAKLQKQGAELALQHGAGDHAGYPDTAYTDVEIVKDESELLKQANVVFTVQPPTIEQIEMMDEGTIAIGYMNPFGDDDRIKKLCEKKITSFSMELVPRISRAQSIDALSSQANAAGYKAVIMAAEISGKFFPMLTTAAGTVKPAKALIIGAGVAGLQAIATAKRLGAIVEAYDVRSATKEQVESLGGKFVDTGVSADGEGGYARELTDEEKAKQQEVLNQHIQAADVVITTAAIPGRKAPILITKDVVEEMKPGAVIVDLAAETGGNCELTKAGKHVKKKGVTIYGPVNVPSTLATDTSELYSKNLLNFTALFLKEGEVELDWEDQIIAESALTHEGEIKSQLVRDRMEGDQ